MESETQLKEFKESNDELKTENAKLYDNILIFHQKITDELGAQLSSPTQKKGKSRVSLSLGRRKQLQV